MLPQIKQPYHNKTVVFLDKDTDVWILNEGNHPHGILLTAHCSRLHHTGSCCVWSWGSHFSVLSCVWLMCVLCCCWQPDFYRLLNEHCGRVEQQQRQQVVVWLNATLSLAKALHKHALPSHKMALALCAQFAHLSVLKLRSELHGGGPGSVPTGAGLHTALS